MQQVEGALDAIFSDRRGLLAGRQYRGREGVAVEAQHVERVLACQHAQLAGFVPLHGLQRKETAESRGVPPIETPVTRGWVGT